MAASTQFTLSSSTIKWKWGEGFIQVIFLTYLRFVLSLCWQLIVNYKLEPKATS